MTDSTASMFELLSRYGHEQVVYYYDKSTGLRAIVCIHNTQLGPALGGCRMYPYQTEQEALADVLRLARGMTYKAAASGLNLGGGKAVIIGDPKRDKSEYLWRAFGRFIESLNGRYITAEDVGTNLADMEQILLETKHVVGVSRASGGSGDPSPVTAFGVFCGMRAAVAHVLQQPSVSGLHVVVQGCGNVGYHLIGHLLKEGAQVTVCDIDTDALQRVAAQYAVQIVAAKDIYSVPCDVFAPCAMGGILNAANIAQLQCKIVAGGANNQLANEQQDGARLAAMGIVYVPDFVLNAGGLINVSSELRGYNEAYALHQAEGIANVVEAVFKKAQAENILNHEAANQLAMERIDSLARVRRIYISNTRR